MNKKNILALSLLLSYKCMALSFSNIGISTLSFFMGAHLLRVDKQSHYRNQSECYFTRNFCETLKKKLPTSNEEEYVTKKTPTDNVCELVNCTLPFFVINYGIKSIFENSKLYSVVLPVAGIVALLVDHKTGKCIINSENGSYLRTHSPKKRLLKTTVVIGAGVGLAWACSKKG